MCRCQIRSYFLRISVILPIEKINGKWSEFVIGARFRYDWQIIFILVFFYIKISTYTSISSNIGDKKLIILHAVPVWVRLPPPQGINRITSFIYDCTERNVRFFCFWNHHCRQTAVHSEVCLTSEIVHENLYKKGNNRYSEPVSRLRAFGRFFF